MLITSQIHSQNPHCSILRSYQDLLKKQKVPLTQNSNKILNGVTWKRRPKDIYVGKNSLELALTISDFVSFNNRLQGVKTMLKV